MPRVPTTESRSPITAVAVSAPPAPGPCSVISRIALPRSMTALKLPVTRASGCSFGTSIGATWRCDAVAREARVREQLDGVAELAGERDVVVVQRVDALERHVVDVQVAVERERGENRELGRGIRAADVLGGIGLGVAELLGLGERVGVALAVARHRAEHEVGRAVDDADQLVDARREPTPEHAHDGDRRAGRGLVAQLRAAVRSASASSSAPCRASSCLLAETTETPRSSSSRRLAERRLDAAHDLGDDLDRRIVADVLEAIGEQPRRRVLPLRAVSRTRARTTRTGRPATRSTTSARSRSSRSTGRRRFRSRAGRCRAVRWSRAVMHRGLVPAAALRSALYAGSVARHWAARARRAAAVELARRSRRDSPARAGTVARDRRARRDVQPRSAQGFPGEHDRGPRARRRTLLVPRASSAPTRSSSRRTATTRTSSRPRSSCGSSGSARRRARARPGARRALLATRPAHRLSDLGRDRRALETRALRARSSLMYILIAGGGKVGRNLTHDLLEMGHEVTVIEQSAPTATARSRRSSSTSSSTATRPSCTCSSAAASSAPNSSSR